MISSASSVILKRTSASNVGCWPPLQKRLFFSLRQTIASEDVLLDNRSLCAVAAILEYDVWMMLSDLAAIRQVLLRTCTFGYSTQGR